MKADYLITLIYVLLKNYHYLFTCIYNHLLLQFNYPLIYFVCREWSHAHTSYNVCACIHTLNWNLESQRKMPFIHEVACRLKTFLKMANGILLSKIIIFTYNAKTLCATDIILLEL